MYLSGNYDEVVYILVSIKNNLGKFMGSGHCYCDILDYNTGTWWICDDDNISEFRGYPCNVYDELSHKNVQHQGGGNIIKVSDRIVSLLYIKRDIIISRT